MCLGVCLDMCLEHVLWHAFGDVRHVCSCCLRAHGRHLCVEMCPDMCADMCPDMCTCMCPDICPGMCAGVCAGVCVDVCPDTCADMCADIHMTVFIDMCINIDMRVALFTDMDICMVSRSAHSPCVQACASTWVQAQNAYTHVMHMPTNMSIPMSIPEA